MQRIKDIATVRELIRQEAKLEDIAKLMYGVDLRPSGSDDLKAKCPFHEEDTASFGIRKSKQLYHCFGCKEGGDVFKFVQSMDNCEHIEAVRKLAEFARFDLGPYKEAYTEADRKIQEYYNINADVMELAALQRASDEFKTWVATRKFDLKILEEYGVGYNADALGPESVPAADSSQANSLGLGRNGAWQNVIVVPVRDPYGRVTGFRNRLLDPNSTIKLIGPDQSHPLPVPQIYGLYEARKHIRQAGHLILVEGEPDVWQMASHGYRNVASMQGTKLNNEMIQQLESLSINKITILADNDDTGRKFARAVAQGRHGNALVKIATLSGNFKDPDEFLLGAGTDPIDQALAGARYTFEYLVDTVCDSIEGRRQTDKLDVLNEVKPHAIVATELEREFISRLLADRLGLDYSIILDFFREGDAATPASLHNVHAERVVLKRMLTDDNFVGEGLVALKSNDFYLSSHRSVFEAIGKLYRKQETINEDTVRTFVENQTGTTQVGLFGGLLAQSLDTSSADYLLADLRDKSIRRNVQAKARDAVNRLGDTRQDAKGIVQSLSSELAASVVGHGNVMVTAGQIVQERMNMMHQRMKNPSAIIGYDIGADFPVLNATLHGLQTKRYIVVSAPSGAGKTAFMCCLLRQLGVNLQVPSLAFSFETGAESLTDRLVSGDSGVEADKIITGYLTAEEAKYVHASAARVAASPLIITERGLDFDECAALIRHDVLRRGTKVVAVDYIQLMTLMSAGNIRRDQELGLISRGFLELAKELDIVLIVLAQQNREAVKGGSNEGTGIGESFKIFQDSDVFITFREKTKDEITADGPDKGNRRMKLPKHRHGKGGVEFDVMADLAVMRMWQVSSSQKQPVR